MNRTEISILQKNRLRNEEMFKEKEVELGFQKENLQRFYRELEAKEKSLHMQMIGLGWKYIRTNKRTVIFTFGEATINRRCYQKGGENRYPIDEYLGLQKYSRYSLGLLHEIAYLATTMSYRKVVEIMEKVKGIYITPTTVVQAVKLAGQLYQERDDYEEYQEKAKSKRSVPVLYIEGDGVMIKVKKGKQTRKDLSHFVIHEGVEEEYKNRRKLKNKHEILSKNNKDARDKLLTYLDEHYEITPETLIVTNSDMGHGYTPYIFKEIAKVFGARHEHFWDAYHLREEINRFFLHEEDKMLQDRLYDSIYEHDKKETVLILDTIESTLESDTVIEQFQQFSKRLLTKYQHTNPARNRGIQVDTLGVIETQHTKITSRMKNRKMYWSIDGAETMARMIIDEGEGSLESLFFGEWRQIYQEIQKDTTTVSDYLKKIEQPPTIPTAKIWHSRIKY